MSDNLAELRRRRSALIKEYGNRGQKHPMGRMIGGLNPAAQELHRLRGQIAALEAERAPARAEVRLLSRFHSEREANRAMGLIYSISFLGEEGKLGKDNFGKWYVIADDDIQAENLATLAKARVAFERYVKGLG